MNKVQLLPKSLPKAIRWEDNKLYLLDQTRLPAEVVFEQQKDEKQVWQSIRQLKVRGAPAIGIAAAYGLCVALEPFKDADISDYKSKSLAFADYLGDARPTAVNLRWAMDRLKEMVVQTDLADTSQLHQQLIQEAEKIHAEDIVLCLGMARNGLPLIKPGMGILTHCNAGSLATSELGTATAPMYLAHQNGIPFKVYADETRPLLQGARLTSWELQQAGIDVTLITDNMAAHLMSQGLVDMVITGTDRVAANGDVANKIGTLGVAILAKHFSIPFYVACPSSTIDLNSATGEDIPIEEREAGEVTTFAGVSTAPEGIQVRNPAFDVTPNNLVSGLITEKGLITAPYREKLADMFG
ncbi:S-methyl-5-thioribose-1-phosphate isomerase [Sneathiella glossodoripedis]|uniref:S-methyl-5-thioribose-1-phosphate isomerase n=1 Tax=Sneathiella glossodoripedis TaxID=418853 RepID=UPI0004726DF2|nr:S-methyl-5-thioribose-1-phosphate isomerase [Sneathiella glossodoripedis]